MAVELVRKVILVNGNSKMFCVRCKRPQSIFYKKLNVEELNILGDWQRIDCIACESFIALTDDNSSIIDIDNIIVDKAFENGWKKMTTNKEKIIYYILSQIIYPEIDVPRTEKFESIYDFAHDSDEVFLRWKNDRPVGFYTIKPKGTKIDSTVSTYSMNTVDTAYIRSQYRNQGLGLEILNDVVKRYPDQDIGFSKPISHGMLCVLEKFLTSNKKYRLLFWEIENGGVEGSMKLIWFTLRKQIKANQVMDC